jgi:hypothetical protein
MAVPEADAVHDTQHKPSFTKRIQQRGDDAMARRGVDEKHRALVWHFLKTFWEQVYAIVPISIIQV